ncbi:lytic polysaccharide monooxygenase [Providencia alcalifaciens]
MAQVINTNYLSLVTQNNLNKSQGALGSAIERLSSGLRINSAKDDAAGQAIANRFTSNVNGLTQASRNANDGISIAQTTEGALNEINNNLQRIRELTVQAKNGTNSNSDITSIQNEVTERLAEINRISEQTQFNGVKVLSGEKSEMTIQVGTNDKEVIKFNLDKVDNDTLGVGNDKLYTETTVKKGETKAGATVTADKLGISGATAYKGSLTVNEYEVESIEGLKGFPNDGPADGQIASGGKEAFSALNEQSADRWHKVAMKSGENTCKWTLTAKHSTASWQFFITKPEWDVNKPLTRADFDLTPFCQQDDNGKIPTATVEVNCNIPERSGYQVILGVWNIADTGNAFYQVIDADFKK